MLDGLGAFFLFSVLDVGFHTAAAGTGRSSGFFSSSFFRWPLLQAVDKWIVLRLGYPKPDLLIYPVVVVLPASIRTESPQGSGNQCFGHFSNRYTIDQDKTAGLAGFHFFLCDVLIKCTSMWQHSDTGWPSSAGIGCIETVFNRVKGEYSLDKVLYPTPKLRSMDPQIFFGTVIDAGG